ncbi:MAG TPA: tautomerase family protein [Kineosporiaceae bacterium]|jgi:phenylpyruvate tautomerase PptA (4-oxalocrotonate tautomerase family)|nr:tautomerase family protein [Kineosporiaceae bacterium]
MPYALVEVRRSSSEAEEGALLDAVHAALVAAFRIPERDRHLRLVEHAPHRFACPPDLAHPELFTLVTIDGLAGRSIEAKRRLYREVVQRLEACGIPRDHVSILLRESEAQNWGVRGGQAASDVDLGFEVRV